MNIKLDNQVAVVTGGTGGIGQACVRSLLESGAKVAIIGHSEGNIKQTIEHMKRYGEVRGFQADLSDVEQIPAVVEEIRSTMGPINILVQTAGILTSEDGFRVTPEIWEKTMDVNAKGLFFMMQKVVEKCMCQAGGVVINFASMAGIRGMTLGMCSAHYSASKGAVVAMTMQAAVEWAPLGVRVNAIAPGGVLTPAMKSMNFPPDALSPVPLKKLSTPEDVANLVVFLASDKAAMITGQTIIIDGGSSIVGY